MAGQRVITKQTLQIGIRELFNGSAGQVGRAVEKDSLGAARFSHTVLGVVFFVCLIVLAYLIL